MFEPRKQERVPTAITTQGERIPFSARNPAVNKVVSPGMGKQRLFKNTTRKITV
jgi:hypothetical protein